MPFYYCYLPQKRSRYYCQPPSYYRPCNTGANSGGGTPGGDKPWGAMDPNSSFPNQVKPPGGATPGDPYNPNQVKPPPERPVDCIYTQSDGTKVSGRLENGVCKPTMVTGGATITTRPETRGEYSGSYTQPYNASATVSRPQSQLYVPDPGVSYTNNIPGQNQGGGSAERPDDDDDGVYTGFAEVSRPPLQEGTQCAASGWDGDIYAAYWRDDLPGIVKGGKCEPICPKSGKYKDIVMPTMDSLPPELKGPAEELQRLLNEFNIARNLFSIDAYVCDSTKELVIKFVMDQLHKVAEQDYLYKSRTISFGGIETALVLNDGAGDGAQFTLGGMYFARLNFSQAFINILESIPSFGEILTSALTTYNLMSFFGRKLNEMPIENKKLIRDFVLDKMKVYAGVAWHPSTVFVKLAVVGMYFSMKEWDEAFLNMLTIRAKNPKLSRMAAWERLQQEVVKTLFQYRDLLPDLTQLIAIP